MRNVLYLVCLCAALTFARQAAAQDVTRQEFLALRGEVGDLRTQVQVLVGLQRETLAALRCGSESSPIQFASATRALPVRYGADDTLDGGEDACMSWSPETGLPETGRITIHTWGDARLLLPVGDRGYLAAGRSRQTSPAPRSVTPASYGGSIRSASYHRGLISSPYSDPRNFSTY